jgi:hypothetical protein
MFLHTTFIILVNIKKKTLFYCLCKNYQISHLIILDIIKAYIINFAIYKLLCIQLRVCIYAMYEYNIFKVVGIQYNLVFLMFSLNWVLNDVYK